MICNSSRTSSRILLAAATALLCLLYHSPARAQAAAAAVTATARVAGGNIHGEVKAGAIPLPGVSIIATDGASGSKFATVTDANGKFSMKVPAGASYSLRAELAAFEPMTQKVQLTGESAVEAASIATDYAVHGSQVLTLTIR